MAMPTVSAITLRKRRPGDDLHTLATNNSDDVQLDVPTTQLDEEDAVIQPVFKRDMPEMGGMRPAVDIKLCKLLGNPDTQKEIYKYIDPRFANVDEMKAKCAEYEESKADETIST